MHSLFPSNDKIIAADKHKTKLKLSNDVHSLSRTIGLITILAVRRIYGLCRDKLPYTLFMKNKRRQTQN